jgi:hypothetical protein
MSSTDWTTAFASATDSIRTASATDLAAVQQGVDLAWQAAGAATSVDLAAALRWMAISESVIAVADDVARLTGEPTALTGGLAAGPMRDNPATRAALRELWLAIHGGLHRYMSTTDGRSAICAATTARSVLRLIEAGADQ